jgi:hypothetical protein
MGSQTGNAPRRFPSPSGLSRSVARGPGRPYGLKINSTSRVEPPPKIWIVSCTTA